MNVLVACEYSGVVRDAFAAAGHFALSCDILETETSGPHYRGDVRDLLGGKWDVVIAHPPCTDLCVSGARWFPEKVADGRQAASITFFMLFARLDVPRIAIENPIDIMSKRWRKPDQIVQPWMFGHGETKATCLWLKGLPPLTPTNVVAGREARVHRMPPSEERSRERSRTYAGIAQAMAAQWGAS